MANAGMHALIGAATKRWIPKRAWLYPGIIFGSMFPDLDNYAVAVVTLTGGNTEALHRTFSHSVLTIALVLFVFPQVGRLKGDKRWTHFGWGLAAGIGLHMLADMLIWFNGVHLLWPFGPEFNFWGTVTPPTLLATLVSVPAEPLFFALYFGWLDRIAQPVSDRRSGGTGLRRWRIAMWVIFVIILPLAYLNPPGFFTGNGLVYLIALTAACLATLKHRDALDHWAASRS